MFIRIAFFLVMCFSIHAKCTPTFERLGCMPTVEAEDNGSAVETRVPALAPPKWTSPYRISQFALVGAAAADIASSWGCAEANPLLRSGDGRFRAQGLAIKAGVTAGSLVAAHYLVKRFPKLEKPLAFAMGTTSTFLYTTAFRNHSQACY